MNYATQFATRNKSYTAPVSEPLPAQIPNHGGGFSYEIDKWGQLDRFLILGADGGTYYVGERDLVKLNHTKVLECIKESGLKVVARTVEISGAGRAYKNDPAIFVLALCCTHGTPETKAEAYASIPEVCRIGTHLFHFVSFVNQMRGWSRGLRNAIAKWYTGKKDESLAMQAIKYQQRDGWSHRDVLRLAHISTKSPVVRWMVGGKDAMGVRTVKRGKGKDALTQEYPAVALPALIEAFEEAKTADVPRLIKLIVEHELPREAIPTDKLNDPGIWDALLCHMGLTAVIRNLVKMTAVGLIKPLSGAVKMISAKLKDAKELKSSRIHPMQCLIASKIYAQGHGDKGSLSWSPVPALVSVLEEAFYATFSNVEPVGKPMLIALDVSGSMSSQIAGSCITCCEGTAALSLIHANVEPENVHIFGFSNHLKELGIRKGMSIAEATRRAQDSNFGSTNVGLAIEYAIQNKIKVGGFVIMTDSEVNQGSHPSARLRQYRDQFVADAKQVVVGMTCTEVTVADPKDKLSLDVAGFDAAVPAIIADFIR